jgi:hypothetical protein
LAQQAQLQSLHEQPPAQQSQWVQSQLAPQQQPPSQQLAVVLAPACVPPKPLNANEANATEKNFNMIELLVRHPALGQRPSSRACRGDD